MKRAALVLALVLPALALCGCSSVLVGGSVGLDAGTLAVSGVGTGVGLQTEIIGFNRSQRLGVGPSAHLVGYSTSGDGDPIWLTTVEARYRVANRFGGPGYLHVGTGLGGAWTPDLRHVAVPFQIEFGIRHAVGRFTARIGIRERLVAVFGTGTPPWDAVNSVQLTTGITVSP